MSDNDGRANFAFLPTPTDLDREARRLEHVRRLTLTPPLQLDAARAERQRLAADPDPQEAA